MKNQQPEALRLAQKLKEAIQLLDLGFDEDIDPDELDKAALELQALHTRNQELEAFAKEIEQYGVLLRTGGAAPHDLKDLSAAQRSAYTLRAITTTQKKPTTTKKLGMECDRRKWERVQKLWEE